MRTFPHFRDVTLDSLVRSSVIDAEDTSDPAVDSTLEVRTSPEIEDDTGDDDPLQIGLKVGNLRDRVVDAREISYSRESVDVLGILQSDGFVFVRNEVDEVGGIVTAADLAHAYGDAATPFCRTSWRCAIPPELATSRRSTN